MIVFNGNRENFRMLDPMWIVNMSAADINKLYRHNIFYDDKDAHQIAISSRRLLLLLSWNSCGQFMVQETLKMEGSKTEDSNRQGGVCWCIICVCHLSWLTMYLVQSVIIIESVIRRRPSQISSYPTCVRLVCLVRYVNVYEQCMLHVISLYVCCKLLTVCSTSQFAAIDKTLEFRRALYDETPKWS
ncbi:hypothetical protein Hanom_Chr16g01470461 [Helianthus anomalus]